MPAWAAAAAVGGMHSGAVSSEVGAAATGGGNAELGVAAPPPPPLHLKVGGGGGGGEGGPDPETPAFGSPLPAPLSPVVGAVDPTAALGRDEVLGVGGDERAALPWARRLGFSPLRAARYHVRREWQRAYATAMAEEACALVAGLTPANEARKEGGRGGGGGGGGGAAAKAMTAELRFLSENTSNSVWGSSICVRADEGDVRDLKAAITGPIDTPYANGFFVFDIAARPDFPRSSPHVLISSRASGLIRWKCVCKQPLHSCARAQTSAMRCPLRARGPPYSLRAIF
jgi:hypothetical protein